MVLKTWKIQGISFYQICKHTAKVKTSHTSLAFIISILLQLAANHSVPSNRWIFIVRQWSSAAWRTLDGRLRGWTVRPLDRPTGIKGSTAHFLLSFIVAAGKLLVACCNVFFLVANSYSRALPYWRFVKYTYPYLLTSSMPYGPQSSGAGHPHQLFSAMWFLGCPVCWWS